MPGASVREIRSKPRRRVTVPTAAPLIPASPTLPNLREAAKGCQACPLWKLGKQTVFGAGNPKARLILVGEQPGFEEDIEGKPFVGPAGRWLDKALAQAGIDRSRVYLTNVVKRFKWESKGTQHMHAKPNVREITACLPWLAAELAALDPEVIVCLGATAAQALLGRDFRVTRQRGEILIREGYGKIMGTAHPASILRAPDSEPRHREFDLLVRDFNTVARFA